MSHKDGRVVLSAWVEPVLRDYVREAARLSGLEFSRWVERAVRQAMALDDLCSGAVRFSGSHRGSRGVVAVNRLCAAAVDYVRAMASRMAAEGKIPEIDEAIWDALSKEASK